jgi:AmmeMemoRadiSam system protein A
MPEGNTDDTPAPKDEVLDPHRQAVLLQLARDAIRQYLDSETAPLPRPADSVLQLPRGAFVTLKRNGTLRGCIGYMAEDSPLCRTVSAMALQAAFNDRRFAPVSIEELSELKIEVSVLTPFKRVEGPEAIRVGIDGVVLEQNGKRAVFLPQVAVERHWDRETLLDNLCGKAGLAPGSWKRGAEFYTFQAQVFAEPDIPKSE